MATPIIQTNGSVSGAGTAGEGRNDLDAAETVTLSDTEAANSGSSYVWTANDIPFGSATTIVNPTTATPTIVVDVVGSYRVTCLVDGSDSSVIVFSVPLANTGSRIPSTGETNEYNEGGNTEGWAEAMDDFMRAVDASLISISDENVKISANDSTAALLGTKLVAGTNVTLTEQNDGGNETLEVAAVEASNILHDDVADEFDTGGGSKKATPINADRLLIEDSADALNKKFIEIGDLPSLSSADALSTTGADVIINTAAPPTTNQILKATSATTATWQTLITSGSSIDQKPDSPNVEDDEFENTVLDAAWTMTPAVLAGAIDPYSTNTGTGPLVEIHTDRRKSWLMLQGKQSTNVFLAKPYTVPTDVLIWARISHVHDTTIGANEAIASLMFSADLADINNDSVSINIPVLAAVSNITRFDKVEATAQTQIGSSGNTNIEGQAVSYAAIQKIGTTFHGWVGTHNGTWIYLGSTVYAGATLDNVGFRFFDGATFFVGTPVYGVDFFRVVESALFLP